MARAAIGALSPWCLSPHCAPYPPVIPAEAGTQLLKSERCALGPRFRGDDTRGLGRRLVVWAGVLIANAKGDGHTAQRIFEKAMEVSVLPGGGTLQEAIVRSAINGRISQADLKAGSRT